MLPLVVVGAFLVFIFLEKPLWEKNKLAKTEVAKLQKELNEIKGKNSSAQKAVNEYLGVGEEKVLIINALPEEKEGNVLMAEFFEKAKKTGAFLKSIKMGGESSLPLEILDGAAPTENEKGKTAVKKDVVADSVSPSKKGQASVLKFFESSMELSGSYEEIRSFILEVERMNRFSNISSFSIKKDGDRISSGPTGSEGAEGEAAGSGGNVQVSLTARSYWMGSRVEEKMTSFEKSGAASDGAKNMAASFSGDAILKDILSGRFSSETIGEFQNSITQEAFQFNGGGELGGVGKVNLF